MGSKTITAISGILVILLASFYSVNNYDISNIKIVDNEFILTYLGIFLGFAITIYTFGVSMLDSIRSNIDLKDDITTVQKARFFKKLLKGFKELKQDIWLMFICFLIVIIFSIGKQIEALSFLKEIEITDTFSFKIDKGINLSIFILSLWATYDLMKALFNVSEIQFELIIKDLEEESEKEKK